MAVRTASHTAERAMADCDGPVRFEVADLLARVEAALARPRTPYRAR